MPAKFRSFILQMGYVEDSIMGLLCFEHYAGFDTVTEAMRHLRSTIIDYLSEDEAEGPTCCTDAREVKQKFCPGCGRSTSATRPAVDGRNVSDFLYALLTTTLDGSFELFEEMERAEWQIQATPRGTSVHISAVGRWLEDWSDIEGDEGGEDKPEPTAADIYGSTGEE